MATTRSSFPGSSLGEPRFLAAELSGRPTTETPNCAWFSKCSSLLSAEFLVPNRDYLKLTLLSRRGTASSAKAVEYTAGCRSITPFSAITKNSQDSRGGH